MIEVELNAQDIGKQEIEAYVENFENENNKGSPITAYWDTAKDDWFLPEFSGSKERYSLPLHAAVDCSRNE